MSSLIDKFEEWFDSLSDEEFIESWEKSTAGMRDTNQYTDFFCDLDFKFDSEKLQKPYKIAKSNLSNINTLYTPDNNSGVFLYYKPWRKLLTLHLV